MSLARMGGMLGVGISELAVLRPKALGAAHPDAAPANPSAPSPWLHLDPLWAETLGDPRVTVALLDGPVDQSHPCFRDADLTQLPTLASAAPGQGWASRHGTHIASMIFGQHDGPVRGIAPRCRGLIVPIFRDEPGDAVSQCSQVDLARAITQALENGAQIINISGGQLDPSGKPHEFLAKAARACAENGALIVASAGNDGCACLHVPAAVPSVLAVGAMDSNGSPLDSSNWGSSYISHGILAPGMKLPGAVPGGGTTTADGTSFSTAIVSGVAALLVSLQRKRGQKPDPRAVKAAILQSALGCEVLPAPDCRRVLAGRLHVEGAMAQITKEETKMSEPIENQATVVMHALYPNPNGKDAATNDAAVLPSTSDQDAAAAITPSACSCGRNTGTSSAALSTPQSVYALGELGFDFGAEARRDSITQQMGDGANPYDPNQLLSYLDNNPSDAAAILWTLSLDGTPIYVIQAQGPFASHVYERLREFLKAQLNPQQQVERISVPGYIAGSARLLNGQTVPVIWAELRGMFSWTTAALVHAAAGDPPPAGSPEADAYSRKVEAIRNFLERVYHELRNLGTSSRERAINFSATNAFNVTKVFESALKDGLDLDAVEVERSPICRSESDCWDVKLSFFNPRKLFEQARKVYRFTVDVSDIVPVTVGRVRSWSVR